MTLLDERMHPAGSFELVPGIYDPDSGMIACVLIHAAYGVKDRRVNNLFDARDWFTGIKENMVLMNVPMDQWRLVASMSREDRPNLKGGRVGPK